MIDFESLVSDECDAVLRTVEFIAEAFPFTRERREELNAIDKAKREGGKLELLLAHQNVTTSSPEMETRLRSKIWLERQLGFPSAPTGFWKRSKELEEIKGYDFFRRMNWETVGMGGVKI